MKKTFSTAIVWMLVSIPLFAQETAEAIPPPQETGYEFWSAFTKMMLVLGALVGLLIVTSWFLKRLMQNRLEQLNKQQTIKIIERRVLGQKSLLYLVEVHGKRLVIGESPAGIHPITEIPFAEGMPEETEEDPRQRVSFSDIFSKKSRKEDKR